MRIVYFSGVVPVERNAGYTLMYRHLLRLTKSGHELLVLTRDYEKARNVDLPFKTIRFAERSRNFQRIANRVGSPQFWVELDARRVRRLAEPYIAQFRPEVIVTVWESAYLLAAADVGKKLGVPVVIVVHDDYEQMLPAHRKKHRWAAGRLRKIYHSVAARICIGPAMAEHLTQTYGRAEVDIIYPIPAEPASPVTQPRRKLKDDPLRIGFFGELGGNYGPIHAVVDVLEAANAEFHYFSHSWGPNRGPLASRPRVFDHGATDPVGLQNFFRANIDVMLIPQGFEPEVRQLRRTCFPSKIPEACQIGLPLLIISPADGSATRWAHECLKPPAFLSTINRPDIVRALREFADSSTQEAQRQIVSQIAGSIFLPQRLHEQFERVLSRVCNTGDQAAAAKGALATVSLFTYDRST